MLTRAFQLQRQESCMHNLTCHINSYSVLIYAHTSEFIYFTVHETAHFLYPVAGIFLNIRTLISIKHAVNKSHCFSFS